MILKALHDLYERLSDEPASGITPVKFAPQKVSFRVTLTQEGSLFAISQVVGPTPQQKYSSEIVPEHVIRSGTKIAPQFMCDKAAYCLGVNPDTGSPAGCEKQFEAFKQFHLAAEKEINNKGYSTFCRFLETWNPEALEIFKENNPDALAKCINFGIFDIQGETKAIHERAEVCNWWLNQELEPLPTGQCLLTGEIGPIARLQPKIKGFASAASLVGVQKGTSYESYQLEQAFTAPISPAAAFKYASALNWLIDGKGRAKHRFYIGDTTCVTWTDRPSVVEDVLGSYFQDGDTPNDEAQDPDTLSKLSAFLRAIQQGSHILTDLGEDPNQTNFYILGIEQPNPGRYSIRFFKQSSVSELIDNLSRHHSDIRIEREYDKDTTKGKAQPAMPSCRELLNQTAVKLSSGKLDYKTIPPLLGGALMRSMIEGIPYPEALYSAVIRRIRADRTVNYLRAAIIKGTRIRNHKRTTPLMLDTTIKQTSYLLGRLFAVMEQAQRQANEFKLERTIRESFFSSASATPASVFPRIHKLHIHHLRKLGQGSQKFFEDLIGEILSKMEKTDAGEISYPKTLTLEQQGGYAIGYYQQMVTLKQKKEVSPDSETAAA